MTYKQFEGFPKGRQGFVAGDGDERPVGVALGLQKVRHHPLEKLDSVLVEV